MYPPSNPRYEVVMEAARTVQKELNLVFSEVELNANLDYFGYHLYRTLSPEELDEELFFLRSSVDYFYSTRTLPFSSPDASLDFVKTRLPMSIDEFRMTQDRLMNRYRMRLWKICRRFELLDSSLEQDAFEFGNRLWGGMSVEMINMSNEDLEKEHDIDTLTEKEEKKNDKKDKKDKDGGDDDKGEGVVGRYPLLKKAFRFGSEVLLIPVVSQEVVDKSLVSFGEDRVMIWEKRWKELQIDELNAFLAKLNAIRHYTITLLDVLQGKTDIA